VALSDDCHAVAELPGNRPAIDTGHACSFVFSVKGAAEDGLGQTLAGRYIRQAHRVPPRRKDELLAYSVNG